MATLETRIAALEGGTTGADDALRPNTIFIVGMGEPFDDVSYGGQTWHRQPEESRQDFQQRIAREVKRDRPGQILIL